MTHRLIRWLFACSCALGLGAASAQIGQAPAALLRQLSPMALERGEAGYTTPGGLAFALEERGGLLYRLSGEGVMDEENLPVAAKLLAAGTGYGEAIEGPLREFFEARLGEIAGAGEKRLDVEGYLLTLEVRGEAPYTVSFGLGLPELEAAAFPPAAHALGPEDAAHVIRVFSDFQCPYCARFAAEVLPSLEEALVARGDVRVEFHHFPLQSIHANALAAAEAAECVAAENGEAAFWSYHDALFERQQAWQGLGDPSSYFVRLAQDLGLASAEMAPCLAERRYAGAVQAAYQAALELRLSGTPTVFVDGYKVGDYTQLGSYTQLMELSAAFAAEDGE